MLSKFGKLLKSKKTLIALAIVSVLGWAGITVTERDVSNVVNVLFEEDNSTTPTEKPQATKEFNEASVISPDRRAHILYGDAAGGGHLFGQGKPCKSEFPKHWDENTIIKEVELIASNDNLSWEEQRNGYYVTEQKVGTVNVRVVKGRGNKQVITAYPTNTTRNPCPANDR